MLRSYKGIKGRGSTEEIKEFAAIAIVAVAAVAMVMRKKVTSM